MKVSTMKNLQPVSINKTIAQLIEFVLSSNVNNANLLNEIGIIKREFEAHNMTFNSTFFKEAIIKSVEGESGIYSEIKNEVKDKCPSLMIESASRHGNLVFLVILSYSLEEKLVKRTIGFISQNQQQTTRHLVYQIEHLLRKVGLTLGNIYTVCTDYEGDNLKVADFINEALAALKLCRGIANINLDLNQMREDEREDYQMLLEEKQVDLEVMQQQHRVKVEQQNEEATIADAVAEEGSLCTKIICGAHIFNIAVKEFIREYEPVIAEVRDLLKTSIRDEFVQLFHDAKVKLHSWEDTFQMMSNVQRFRTQLETIALNEERLRLSDHAWEFMDEYLQVFTPVQLAVKDFQRADITISDFYISWLKMELNIRSVPDGNEQLKTKLLEALKQHKQKFFESDAFVAALLLDPRINWSQNPEDFYGPAMYERGILLLEKVHQVINGLQMNQEADANQEAELRQLLGWKPLQFQGIRQSVNRFLAEPRLLPSTPITPLKYWYNRRNEEPEIYRVSQVVYGAAFSQVKKEKDFKGFALVLPLLKILLGDDHLNAIIVCKNNLELLDKVKFI
ncbi:unnamed protein product [Chironomus riparius]|uniref:Uncharacterized protein n=1 Tax=Chironomus riparius TaxID=315576 RepID=A0A9N9S806_9DIPT|nr:unnamed protein product [Chironomus riparius]